MNTGLNGISEPRKLNNPGLVGNFIKLVKYKIICCIYFENILNDPWKRSKPFSIIPGNWPIRKILLTGISLEKEISLWNENCQLFQ